MNQPLSLDSNVVIVDRGDECVRLSEPGTFVIVPKNTWHTARIHAPTRMLFVTPGEGTVNAEQPERGGG
jgi:quercetin dioxygenase-like cupin family protein